MHREAFPVTWNLNNKLNLVVARPAQDLQGVRQQIRYGVERFKSAARAARQIHN
jgi:hypothetical protein